MIKIRQNAKTLPKRKSFCVFYGIISKILCNESAFSASNLRKQKGGDVTTMDYEKLYNSYYMQVYSYAVSLCKNRVHAEEIAQNTFYKAVMSKSEFRGRSDELTWLCSIAKNIYLDELRKRKNMSDLSESEDLPARENTEKTVEDSDTAFRVHLILHGLEEPYKEVFQLRVFWELAFSQIAAIFGKTESWARVTYHRAKLKIQERMDDGNE